MNVAWGLIQYSTHFTYKILRPKICSPCSIILVKCKSEMPRVKCESLNLNFPSHRFEVFILSLGSRVHLLE
jgi:hypothetical protein